MKLITFILMIALAQVSAKGFGQKINLKVTNTPIEKVLQIIRQQSGYEFIYNADDLQRLKVTLHLKDASVEDAVKASIKNLQLSYTIRQNNIVITRVEPSFRDKLIDLFATIDIRGRVLGENNEPLVGAVVKVKGTKITTLTDNNGEFTLKKVDDKAILIISFLGFDTQEINASQNMGDIKMVMSIDKLDEVQVVSTGYQNLNSEIITGSVVKIDNTLLNRSVSTNVLDRIKNLVPGVYFQNRDPQMNKIANYPSSRSSGIVIRGQSTLNASKEPLIVVDNFPYEGEINNINPNDVESISILKDASAASIWGARSGNGVIVITTKKGKLNQKMKIDISSNVTIIDKPNIKYSNNFLSSGNYIEVEQFLFDKGYFNNQLNDNPSFPIVSPAVELMVKYKAATTDVQRSSLQSQLTLLKQNDVRDDYKDFVYQKAVNQQYSIGIRGGGGNMTYSLSVGHDNNKNNLIRNGYQRNSINSLNTYKPIKNMEVTVGLNYSQSETSLNNDYMYGAFTGLGAPYTNAPLFPYAKLSDGNGNSLAVLQNLRNSYIESSKAKGFLDWNLRPLDEISFADRKTNLSDLLLRFGAKYQVISEVSVQINYQNEKQVIADRNYRSIDTYYSRNMINRFSVYDPLTGGITYVVPKGGILDLTNTNWNSNNLRGQINFEKSFSKHAISGIVGAEIREIKVEGFSRTSYGYNDQFGSSVNNLNYGIFYPTNPSGSTTIPAPLGTVGGGLNRYISYFAIGDYIYNDKYTINLSARKDGANLFGALANDKFKPFMSVGLGWDLYKESFYKLNWVPYLRIRTTFGYQGNTYQSGSAYLTGFYSSGSISGAPALFVSTAPNPRLQWERIKNINGAIDFTLKNNIIKGSIEVYKKEGQNLIQPTPLAGQTGFSTYQSNTANTQTKGLDLMLSSQNLNSNNFKWSTTLVLSTVTSKVVKYNVAPNSGSVANGSYSVGKPLNSIFSYKWAGLNPNNGNPRGMLNGKISEDYTSIINNFNPDSLIFNGSAIPTIYGAFRNDFSYKGFSLSVNISYNFGYVIRRSSISTNYTDLITTGQHSDYNSRWQKAGDENNTNVPSLVYPSNNNRKLFYQFSETLVIPGDHIRLQDIRLGYDLPNSLSKRIKFSNITVFGYANNLNIIWRKNNLGIDPAVGVGASQYPIPLSISFGINANF